LEKDLKGSFKRKHCSPVRDTSYADGIKNKKHGLTLNIVPFISNFTSEARVLVTEDRTETSTDKEGARHTVLKHTTYERTFSLEIDGVDEIDGFKHKQRKQDMIPPTNILQQCVLCTNKDGNLKVDKVID
jgi:hypothetical protein